MTENGFDRVYAELKQCRDMLAAMPTPISYLVIDPSWTGPHEDSEDAQGRRYILGSAAVLDEMRHYKSSALGGLVGTLGGIPVYRRQDMPTGWAVEAQDD